MMLQRIARRFPAMVSSTATTAAVAAGGSCRLKSSTAVVDGDSSSADKVGSFWMSFYKAAKKMMPKISETERVALGAGTVGFDGDIFTGSPSLKKLLETYKPSISAEEQAFLDNECQTFCEMIRDYEIVENKDLPAEAWDYLRDEGFFALKIPKEHGGKGFSTQAVSMILAKLGSQCFDANAIVAVPNSLGPGELLVRYGTPEQKAYYLPRLADGTLIPCFGLTGIHSGSDATSLIGSSGVVEERDGVLGVRASFRKRYITLAPVAGVVGIGFELQDPNGLLKGNGEEGFTVALLERNHQGLRMGPRHVPLASAFPNGTVEGDDVWIPMDKILGGRERCGFGWHMFVECLAEGRGVSLPAGAIAAGRVVSTAVGAYTRVRKQFKVPIAEFGGIQEVMARSTSNTLMCVAGADLMNSIVDNHEAPMIISSIMKQNTTHRGREIIKDGMDILGGAGICRGNMNFLGSVWMSIPIAITVEGANIMTRSFQIIGQGITRCHPHMLGVIDSLSNDSKEAPAKFKDSAMAMFGHGLVNLKHSVTRGISSSVETFFRSSTAYEDGDALVKYHEKQLLRLSANFAYAADLSLLNGGRLKFEELLMGRLADAMGAIYLGYSVLHHYERHRGVEGLEAIVEHAMLLLEHEAHTALSEAAANFPTISAVPGLGSLAGALMGLGVSPLGPLTKPYKKPGDDLTKAVSELMTKPSGARDLLAETIFTTDKFNHRVSRLFEALPVCVSADEISKILRKEKREATPEEQDVLDLAVKLRDEIVQVDSFEKLGKLEEQQGYVRPALASTVQRLKKASSTAGSSSKSEAVASANLDLFCDQHHETRGFAPHQRDYQLRQQRLYLKKKRYPLALRLSRLWGFSKAVQYEVSKDLHQAFPLHRP
eukprot:UC4_evm3s1092